MMKKIVLLIVFIVVIITVIKDQGKKAASPSDPLINPTMNPQAQQSQEEPVNTSSMKSALFVPYWNADVDPSTLDDHDRFIYFGIATDDGGINTTDAGYQNIETFIESTDGKPQLIALRMLDTDQNLKVLEDQDLQQAIISDTMNLVNDKGFDGVVLDLELSALPFDDVTTNVNSFIKRFGDEMNKNDSYFGVTMYGDAYYRTRPFDIKTISESSDEILIMAYDFHKSRGEPGPNFPLAGKETYGYDFKKMITDFKKDVPAEKLTILHGMYGYDWTLGPQGKPLKAAVALPLSDIREMTEPSCDLKNCLVRKDSESGETTLTYRDDESYDHVVWFEEEDSVEAKGEYLESQGINSVGYWVYGYW